MHRLPCLGDLRKDVVLQASGRAVQTVDTQPVFAHGDIAISESNIAMATGAYATNARKLNFGVRTATQSLAPAPPTCRAQPTSLSESVSRPKFPPRQGLDKTVRPFRLDKPLLANCRGLARPWSSAVRNPLNVVPRRSATRDEVSLWVELTRQGLTQRLSLRGGPRVVATNTPQMTFAVETCKATAAIVLVLDSDDNLSTSGEYASMNLIGIGNH